MSLSRNPNPLPPRAGNCDLSAFVNGFDARVADDESTDGQITDCPYTEGSNAARNWW